MADENIITETEEIVDGEISDLVAKYISPAAFQELLDSGSVNPNCVYIVHYNDLPTEISETPILEVFIGSSRVSSIINLNNLPEIFSTKYINSTTLTERVEQIIEISVDKDDLANRLTNLITELENLDFSNNSTQIPSNLGLSNKLYLYFNAESSMYEMFIFHPQLKRFIPLRLIPAKSSPSPTPTPTPTPTTTKLILEYSTIITQPQVSQLHVSGETYLFDLQSMSTINFGRPGNNIFVQGKMAFWSFADIEQYIQDQSPTCAYITYNNCNINFTIGNTNYNTLFHSDFDTLEYKTYTDSGVQKEAFFIKTVNKYLDSSTSQEIVALTKDCWNKPNTTNWSSSYALNGYGTYGLTILVSSIISPESDPTNFPNGYVNGRIYNTITGKRGCTDIDDYIDLITGDTSVIYDSYIECKIPFASLNEYYFSKALCTKSEVVIENG